MSRSKFVIAIVLVTLLITGCAPTATENAPFVRPKPYEFSNPVADFDFFVWSESKTPLIIGSYLRLKARATADTYLNLYVVDSNYKTRQILTNYPLNADKTITLGRGTPTSMNYRLTPPPGTETFIAIATITPFQGLESTNIRHPDPMPELALNARQLTQGLQKALNALPAADWNASILDRRVEWPRKSSLPKVM